MASERRKSLVESPLAAAPTDGRRARGMRSRAAVLERSVQMASREGLEGLTIGALAADLEVHKSNVFALFGSKQELQLATLAAARAILIEHVIAPALASAEGLPRLLAIGDAWCEYLGADVFAGGCFLCAASTEMDGRPGPVRDAVASVMREWIAVLHANVEAAIAAGDLPRMSTRRPWRFGSTRSGWPPTGSVSSWTTPPASSTRAPLGGQSSTGPSPATIAREPSRLDMHDDPLEDFDRRSIALDGVAKVVHVAGAGPAVIVMTEMPGISPHVARFAAGCATQASPCICLRCSVATARCPPSRRAPPSFSARASAPSSVPSPPTSRVR